MIKKICLKCSKSFNGKKKEPNNYLCDNCQKSKTISMSQANKALNNAFIITVNKMFK